MDSREDQLRHARRTLPEHAELERVAAARNTLANKARDARILVDDLTGEQTRAEADVATVRARQVRDQQRMDSGQISNPKDLQNMQHELESLARRIATLEDAELEVMERLEAAQNTLRGVEAELTTLDADVEQLTAARDQRLAEIDAESIELTSRREALVPELPADLLAVYDKVRQAKGGPGAALLRARQCGGCMLTLDNAELNSIRIAPSNEVIRCEECGRILVRTEESGL